MGAQKHRISRSPLSQPREGAILGHEIRTVLNGLLGAAEMLDRSGLSTEQQGWLEAVRISARQLRRLAENFGDDERADLWPEPRPRVFDGPALLEQLIRCHTPAAVKQRDRLLLILDPRLPRQWLGDPCALRQLLDNLLANAIRHTQAGDVVLEALPREKEAGLEFVVTDSGSGIGVAESDRIFEPYRQGRSQESGPTGSRGLGLYICERIVAAMNGSISLAAPSARGSRFRIELPQFTTARDDTGPRPPTALFAGLHCTLDLQPPMLESVSAMLDRLGVRWGGSRLSGPGSQARQGDFALRIAEPSDGSTKGAVLDVNPLLAEGAAPPVSGCRISPPLLPSTLGPALLALVLGERREARFSGRQD